MLHRARKTGLWVATAALGVALLSPPAGAQTKEELDKARADFQAGVALMAANNCAAALPKFQDVAKVKRTPQVLFNIGECEERLGKLVAALGNYRLAAAAAEGDKKAADVVARVGERITSLEERIPKLTVKRGEGADTATVLLDGTELGAGELSAEIPVDPGSHVVIGRVGDKEAFSETVTLEEKGSKTVEVTIEIPEKPVEEAPPPPPPAAPPPPPPSKLPAIIVLGAGVASAAAGGVFLAMRGGAISDLDEACGGDNTCPPSAEEIADRGKLYTGLAQITIPLGVVGIATGIVLLVTSGGGEAKPVEEGSPAEESPSEARRRREQRTARMLRPQVVTSAPGANIGGISVLGRF